MNTKLKQARDKTGLTQVEVAEKVRISERTYQSYEAGEHIPNVHLAIFISDILNESVYDLFRIQQRQLRNSKQSINK